MSGVDINWNMAQPVDVAGQFQKGLEQGRAAKDKRITQNALLEYSKNPGSPMVINALMPVNPELALKLRDDARAEQYRAAAGKVMGGGSVNALAPTNWGQSPAQGAPFTPATADGFGANAPVASNGGLKLNQDALRSLYSIDPEQASKLHQSLLQMDKAQIGVAKERASWMGNAAYHLRTIRNADGSPDIEGRRAAASQMAPQLEAFGVDPAALNGFSFDDNELDRLVTFGQSLDSIIDDNRADRRLGADMADDQADNARADREATSRADYRKGQLGMTARGQDIASRDRRRGQDVSSRDRRAGQAVASADRRRGQDMRPASAGGQTATNPKTGERLRWDGKAWVPAH